MGLLDSLKQVFSASSTDPTADSSEASRRQHSIDDSEFVHAMMWRCTTCSQEIGWVTGDLNLVCQDCDTTYSLTGKDVPELRRGTCRSCGETSDSSRGSSVETISFDCRHCELEWEPKYST